MSGAPAAPVPPVVRFDDDDVAERPVVPHAVVRPGRNLAWVVLLALAATQATTRVASWDFWWHLAIGREAVQTRSSVPVDTFSYTYAGHPYRTKDLIGDILMFLAYDAQGLLGIGLLLAIVSLVAALGLRLAIGRHRPLVFMTTAILLVAAVQVRLVPRPLMFSECMFPLTLGLLEVARRAIGQPGRRERPPTARGASREAQFAQVMFGAVLVVWIWINLHRGGTLGLILLFGFACWAALAHVGGRWRRLRRVLGPRPSRMMVATAFGAAAAAVVLGVVNPSGIALYRTAVEVMDSPIHQQMISEWAPLSWDLAWSSFPATTTAVGVAALAAAVSVVRALLRPAAERGVRAPVDAWHVGVLLLTAKLGFDSVRLLGYAGSTSAILIALVWVDWLDRREIAGRPVTPPRGLDWLTALGGIAAVMWLNPHDRGIGVQAHRYPEGALRAAAELELGPRVYNTFVYGGYVIFQGAGRWRVAIDGRNDMVYPHEFFRGMSLGTRNIRDFAAAWARHPADWVLADNSPEEVCGADGACDERLTFTFLAEHPQWMLVYWSEEAVIYVLREGNDQLAPLAYRFIRPGDLMGSVGEALQQAGGDPERRAEIRRELSRMVQASPDSIRANAALAMYFRHLGADGADEVQAILARLQEIDPDHPAVRELTERFGGP